MVGEKNISKKEGKKENKVWVGKDGIVYIDIVKAVEEKDIMELLDAIKEVTEISPTKVKILLNIMTTSIIRSSRFRKEVGKKFEGLNIEKAAMCGGNVVTRIIATFIIAASNLDRIKIFVRKEEALKWLKEP